MKCKHPIRLQAEITALTALLITHFDTLPKRIQQHLDSLLTLEVDVGQTHTIINALQSLHQQFPTKSAPALDKAKVQISSLCYRLTTPLNTVRFSGDKAYQQCRGQQLYVSWQGRQPITPVQLDWLRILNIIAQECTPTDTTPPEIYFVLPTPKTTQQEQFWSVSFIYDLIGQLSLAGVHCMIHHQQCDEAFERLTKDPELKTLTFFPKTQPILCTVPKNTDISTTLFTDHDYPAALHHLILELHQPKPTLHKILNTQWQKFVKTHCLQAHWPVAKQHYSKFIEDPYPISAIVEPRVEIIDLNQADTNSDLPAANFRSRLFTPNMTDSNIVIDAEPGTDIQVKRIFMLVQNK